jgi:hypothetical protein
MAAYKLIEVVKDETKETPGIYDQDTLEAALIKMHNDFGVAVKQATTVGVYCAIIDNMTGARSDVLQWGEAVKDRVYTHNDVQEDNVASYDSEQLAIGNYHTKLASQRNNASINFAVTVRLDGKGNFKDFDAWTRPYEPAPEPEPEEG